MNALFITGKQLRILCTLNFQNFPQQVWWAEWPNTKSLNTSLVINSFPGMGWGSQYLNSHVSALLEDDKGADLYLR